MKSSKHSIYILPFSRGTTEQTRYHHDATESSNSFTEVRTAEVREDYGIPGRQRVGAS